MRVCVTKWGPHGQAMENCIKDWVTTEVEQIKQILSTVPWCSPELDEAAGDLAQCLKEAGAEARTVTTCNECH